MTDTDLELERHLRTHFRDERAADPASLRLRRDVLAIPQAADMGRHGGRARRRGLTLLAAMVALVVGTAGLALLAGGYRGGPPAPSPQALVVAPTPAATPAESPAPSGVSVAPADATGPGLAAGWMPAGTLSVPRLLATGTLLQDGRVLVVGGITSTGAPIAQAEIWDPATRTFSPAGTLSRPRIGHAAALLHDGRVLIVGGEDGRDMGQSLATEVWDPATGDFTVVGTMPPLQSGATATTLLDGRVLIVRSSFCHAVPDASGAPRTDRCPAATAESSWLWSPDGTVVAGPQVVEDREWHTATLLPDGRVLLVGNNGWAADAPESSEVYDPSANAFARVGEPLDYVQGFNAATLLPDGRVLVTGGDTADPNGDPRFMGPLRTAETWDPASGTFSRAGTMDVERRAHQAALLPDGRVIVVGGSGVRSASFIENATPRTEIWDPATGTFEEGPALAEPRARFALVTLADGSLLAIGGAARSDVRAGVDAALGSAELLSFAP